MGVDERTYLEVLEYRLRLSRGLRRGEAPQLRGFFGHTFAEAVMLHHHAPDGRLVYDYPRVQFKVLGETGVLIGLEEACELLMELWMDVDHARIGQEDLAVLDSTVTRRRAAIGATGRSLRYRFAAPWLALNQANHDRYRNATGPGQRRAVLERVLIGNCLALAKAFGHHVDRRLQADCGGLRETKTRLKGVTMLGFVGTFAVNFALPLRIGLGKSVARGFGTVEPQGGNHAD